METISLECLAKPSKAQIDEYVGFARMLQIECELRAWLGEADRQADVAPRADIESTVRMEHGRPWKGHSMTKSIAPSEAFKAFTRYMIQDYEMFGSLDGVIHFGLRCINTDDPALIPEFSNYLKRILVPSISDAQLENLWNSSGAEFGGGGRWVRHVLTRTLEIVEEDAPNGILRKRPVQLKPM